MGKTRSLAQLRHKVEEIFRKRIPNVGIGSSWNITENGSGQLEISNGTNTFLVGTFGGNTVTTDANYASEGKGLVYGAGTDTLRAESVQIGRNGPTDLAGVTGSFDSEVRTDDGTNTAARGTLCVWDGNANVWRPQNDPATGSFS